jgi:hypothetical protein
MVVRTWCEKEYRNKGIVTNLYRFLYNDLQYALLSDVQQTPETLSIWNKVKEYWPVRMISLSTGKIEEIDNTKLYDETLDFVLIVERREELPKTNPFYKTTLASSELLEDYRFNTDGL